ERGMRQRFRTRRRRVHLDWVYNPCEVGSREDSHDAGQGSRLARIDSNASMRIGTAEKRRVGHVGKPDIIDIPSLPSEEARILDALDTCPNIVANNTSADSHGSFSFFSYSIEKCRQIRQHLRLDGKPSGPNCRGRYPWAVKGCRDYFSANVVAAIH